ncbi:unnamed protein product [Coregonus sp. 'balchen']|nr:unnamed protein product [Coregonus sp. 'balchen']
MSSLWKLKRTIPLAPAKSSGTPLYFVQCIGKALLQPSSEVARQQHSKTDSKSSEKETDKIYYQKQVSMLKAILKA